MVCADKDNFYYRFMRQKFKKEIVELGDLIVDISICMQKGSYWLDSEGFDKLEQSLEEWEHECFVAYKNYKLFEKRNFELPEYSEFKSKFPKLKKIVKEESGYLDF